MSATTTDLCACGHRRIEHIYEEGACRPGFVCPNACDTFRAAVPHADRDRSEPYWPPAATAAYAELDEPVPFILTDEPVGVPVPVVPAGIDLKCGSCMVTLFDTAGGRLEHHDDGSHTYVPGGAPGAAPLHGQATARDTAATVPVEPRAHAESHGDDCERCYWKGRALAAEATVARVEALAQQWKAGYNSPTASAWSATHAEQLRIALNGEP